MYIGLKGYQDAKFTIPRQNMVVYMGDWIENPALKKPTLEQIAKQFKVWSKQRFSTPKPPVFSRADIQHLPGEGAGQWIKDRSDLSPNPLNQPPNCTDFVALDFEKQSRDPYYCRFLKINVDESLQNYLDLTIQYPRDFAEVQRATLMTPLVNGGCAECPGILCTRNDVNYARVLTSSDGLEARHNLRTYLYTRVKNILSILSNEGYVHIGNLERHLQFWRVPGCVFQLRLAFFSIEEDIPTLQNISAARAKNDECFKNFCSEWKLPDDPEELTLEQELEAEKNWNEWYAFFTLNTIPPINPASE